MPRAVVVGAALSLALGQAVVLAIQTPTELVRLAQSLLGTGVPVALVVERQDLRRTAGRELHATGPGAALELLQSEGGTWEVSREPVVRIARRERPREVDEALAKPVQTDGQPLSIERAIFIVPRLALNGELHGVVGGGVPSEACQLDREIRTDNRAQTLRQAPDVGWVLAWDLTSTLSLGVVCADGSLSLLSMDPSP